MSRSGAQAQRDPNMHPRPDAPVVGSDATPSATPRYDRARITAVGSVLGWIGMTMTLMMVHLGTHRYSVGWLLLSALPWGVAIGIVFEMLMHARAHDRARRARGWLTALCFIVFAALALLLLAVATSWGPWQH